MINVLKSKKKVNYANKGMRLESDIESTNQYYLNANIACIHKKPTPIQIVKVEFPARNKAKIVEAYYRTPSTTDYNGLYLGRYIDFDVKECSSKTSFPLKNIPKHQMDHLTRVYKMGGIAFLIIAFSQFNKYYLVPIQEINEYIVKNERNSLPYLFFTEKCYEIKFSLNPRLDYLKIVREYLF